MLYKFFMYLRELPKNNNEKTSDSCTGIELDDEGEHEEKDDGRMTWEKS